MTLLIPVQAMAGRPNRVRLTGANPAGDSVISPGTARHTIQIRTDGTIWSVRLEEADSTQVNSGTDWHLNQTSPTGNYWARLTPSSGDALNYGTAADGTTWHKILGAGAATLEFGYTNSTPTSSKNGYTTVEISDSATGLRILATADYGASAVVDL